MGPANPSVVTGGRPTYFSPIGYLNRRIQASWRYAAASMARIAGDTPTIQDAMNMNYQ